MKDFLGNELVLNDVVVFMEPKYRSLFIGRIDSFTPKMINIKFIDNKVERTVRQLPNQIMKK